MDSPCKWHGGKHYLASKIVALFPADYVHYVEPYAGGLSVLLATNPEGKSEVINDLNRGLTNFWRVLQTPIAFDLLRRILEVTPFSEDEWLRASNGPPLDDVDVDAAVRFFVRCRQSLAGRMESFAPLSRTRTRRGMNEQASAWLNAIEGLGEVHARLKRVVVLNRPALKVIESQDGPRTLFYLDPPYPHDTRATTGEYTHEMTDRDHSELLTALSRIEGSFLLSGYRNPKYDAAASAFCWTRHDFDLPNNAAGGAEKRRMTECVWTNY